MAAHHDPVTQGRAVVKSLVPSEYATALSKLAAADDRSVSSVIRSALLHYLVDRGVLDD